MTQLTRHCRILVLSALATLFVTVDVALGQGGPGTTTVTITDPNAQVLVFVTKTKPLNIPPAEGQGGQQYKIDTQLFTSTSAPIPDGLDWYYCGNGKYVAAPAGANIDDVCPEKEREKLVYIPIGGSATFAGGKVIATSGGAVAPTPAAPAPASPSPAAKLVMFQIGGDFGAKKFSGINNCASFLIIVPEATCSNGTTAFTGGVDGAVVFARYVGAIGAYYRTTEIARNATGTTSSGSIGESSKVGSQIELVGGGIFLPFFGPATLSFDVAAAFQQIRQREVQSLGSPTSPTTTITNLHVNTINPAGGAKVQVLLKKHIGVQGSYMYIVGAHSPGLNEHNNLVTGGIYVSF
jgi:hypothetical protein